MRFIVLLLVCFCTLSKAHGQSVHGHVYSSKDQTAIPGVTVSLKQSNIKATTDLNGYFSLVAELPDTLIVRSVGFEDYMLPLTGTQVTVDAYLVPSGTNIEEVEVVSTGYYQIPKERATGAFTFIDNKLLNRSVGSNILDRLEGVASGVLFNRQHLEGTDVNGAPEIRVRGLSTIEGDASPLIVLDGFPYDGDIEQINPNDVENITILKDASAASIWGAKAGNGVIVITSKRGKEGDRLSVSLNANRTIIDRPDLFYSPKFLPAPIVMSIQEEKFNRGGYPEQNQTRLPAYIELLISKRDGLIGDDEFERRKSIFMGNDLRDDVYRLLHRNELRDQYNLSLRGGGSSNWYGIHAGYDKQLSGRVGDQNSRMSLQIQNGIKLGKSTEISSNVSFVKLNRTTNSTNSYTQGEIYESLIDENGNPNAIGGNGRLQYRLQAMEEGLLDWLQRPLEEPNLNDHQVNRQEIRIQTNIKQALIDRWNISFAHQYIHGQENGHNLYKKNSYYARNLVNRYTQLDGKRVIPEGGVMEYTAPLTTNAHTIRAQTDFVRDFNQWGSLNLLAGAEIRDYQVAKGTNVDLFGFDESSGKMGSVTDLETRFPTRPSGSSRILAAHTWTNHTIGRYLSYFANMGYDLQERFILSGSVRWDGSNLLGVNANQRGTVLSSVGFAYNAHKEPWVSSSFSQMKFRLTYGVAGNIDKSQSHYPTLALGTHSQTGLTMGTISHPGNPDLKWEKVTTFNGGVDFRFKSLNLHGSLDLYNKNAEDLLGTTLMDPTTGVIVGANYKMNYASLRTQGIDLQLSNRARIINDFELHSTILLSTSSNKVTKYNAPQLEYAYQYITLGAPKLHTSMDMIYAYPWTGLNPTNGLPMAEKDGELITDPVAFRDYFRNLPHDDLIHAGTSTPTVFASYRLGLAWRAFSVSALLSYKGNYVYRRTSVASAQEFLDFPVYHTDYFKRWEKPGDELMTDVPAYTDRVLSADQNEYYVFSGVLIEPGDHIRLQDISLNYDLPQRFAKSIKLQGLKCYLYTRNLGVLWKKSKRDLDPDFPNLDYPPRRSFAFGIQASF